MRSVTLAIIAIIMQVADSVSYEFLLTISLFNRLLLFLCEPGCSVSVVPGYELEDRAIEVRFPANAKGILL
jgi:hypothetical protein